MSFFKRFFVVWLRGGGWKGGLVGEGLGRGWGRVGEGVGRGGWERIGEGLGWACLFIIQKPIKIP